MIILDKYIELVEKGYCSDCNELNCIDNFPQEKIVREIKDLQKKAELGEHYKHLYSEVKKQKDDVVEYIKSYDVFKEFSFPLMKKWEENEVKSSIDYQFKESIKKELLRMLGEIDVKD